MDEKPASSGSENGGEEGPGKVEAELRLKQNIGIIRGSSVVVGTVIGSGIFIFPQGILRQTGSVGLSLIVWALGAVISFLGALTMAELGSVVRKSGSAYSYIYECYGRLVSFLFVWTYVTIAMPSVMAVSALTFSKYLLSMVEFCGHTPELPVKICAAAMIVTLALINAHSTGMAAPVMIVCTFLKMAALVVIVIGGIVRIAQGYTSSLETGFEGSTTDSAQIALAFYSINYSYGGWETIYMIFEEVKNPKRTLLLSTGGGLLSVAVLYVLANVSFLTAMSPQQLLASDAVAMTWGEEVLGPASILIPIAVVISVFGAASGTLFTGARVVFAASRDNNLPEFFSFISVSQYAPVPAILWITTLALVFLAVGDISELVNFLMFPGGCFQIMSIVALFIFRRTRPDAARFFRVPLLIPVLVVLKSMFLVLTPLVMDPRLEFLYAFCFVLAGVLLYFPFVHLHLKPAVLEKLETKLQLLLQVSPTTHKED